MANPKRIQLSRRKGYRKPDGAVVVSRPSKWGNPFTVGMDPFAAMRILDKLPTQGQYSISFAGKLDKAKAVECFRHYATCHPKTIAVVRAELRGKDLACWCKDGPCHADVLLEIAIA